jgi:hypothetical protein
MRRPQPLRVRGGRAHSQQGAAMSILRINAIKCIEQEDHWGDDHAYILVNGSRVWGPKEMDDGQTRAVNIEVAFENKAEIALFEQDDHDPDDSLDAHTLRSSDEGEHHLKYTADDANYSLWVTIVNTNHSALPPKRKRNALLSYAGANVFTKPPGKVSPVAK